MMGIIIKKRNILVERALLLLAIIFCCMYSHKAASAQAVFRIPEDVTDFKSYSIPEHCIALMNRLNKQLATEKDSTFVIREILAEVKIDTTPEGVREQLAACGTKFRDMKVPADSVYRETMDGQVADALLLAWAARDTGWLLSIIDNDLRANSSASSHAVNGVMSRVTDAIFSFAPLSDDDLQLWDSLYTAIVISQYSNHNGDLNIFRGLINSLSQRARIVSQYDKAWQKEVLRDIVSKVDSLGVSDLDYDKETDHPFSGAVQGIKYQKRGALLTLNGDSLISILRSQGPDKYIDALVRIEHISGYRDAVVPSGKGRGREMRALPGNIVYKDGKFLLPESVTHNELPDGVTYSYDPDQPYVVVYMESLCNMKAFMPSHAHRILSEGSATGSCLKTMEALKWISKKHPDIKVVLWTPFRGQVGPLLTETPAKEARELVRVLDEFYGIPADVVMYNTEFYNMPDSHDRRRIDVSVEFLEWLLEVAGGMYERAPKMLIVSPGGKIMANTYNIKVLNAMMEWYRNSPNLAGLGNRN